MLTEEGSQLHFATAAKKASSRTAAGTPHSLLPPDRPLPDSSVPNFISALRAEIDLDDLIHLRMKGALSLPQPPLQIELLRKYVQYVHPFLPLLDLEDLLQPVYDNGNSTQVSLLLFQAVMFAATAFVDMRYLEAEGFRSRTEARKAFFDRVKVSSLFRPYECGLPTLADSKFVVTL